MTDSPRKIDELCRVVKSKHGGLQETLEVKEYLFDPASGQMNEVVFKEYEDRTDPSKNKRKEISRKALKPDEIPEEVRQKIRELGIVPK